jgi:hypothetical protein
LTRIGRIEREVLDAEVVGFVAAHPVEDRLPGLTPGISAVGTTNVRASVNESIDLATENDPRDQRDQGRETSSTHSLVSSTEQNLRRVGAHGYVDP